MNIKRHIKQQIENSLFKGKVVIVYGARQVGKTTMVKDIISSIPQSAYFSCDEPDIRESLTNKTSSSMKAFLGNPKVLVLDEAQRVLNIGVSLKLLHDTYPGMQIIATGSSSFELANRIVEPLTGRNISFTLYPISYPEYVDAIGFLEANRLLRHRLIFGMYPGIINSEENQTHAIERLANDYLFKDILRVESIRKPIIVEKLARLLAMQVGSEVSYNEIAQKLEVSRPTIISYVRLLEQAFVIFRLPPFGRNPRNEITRFEKIYFYDTGIRNALIGDFSPLENRKDIGHIFENFCVVERLKQCQRIQKNPHHYFWRTKGGSEIDLVEEEANIVKSFECKWKESSIKIRAWKKVFPNAPVTQLNSSNIIDVLLKNDL
ncbi:MAG: ATP-binding protein [Patescibacteria group bacterium]